MIRLASRVALAVLLALAGLTMAGVWRGPRPRASPARPPLGVCAWQEVPTALPPEQQLHAVSGASANDVWAVGSEGGLNTVIDHWDGSGWRPVRHQRVDAHLWDVEVLDANQGWAVGEDYTATGLVAYRWNGSRWRKVGVPQPSEESNNLYAIDAISAADVWAGGSYSTPDNGIQPLFLHWDGVRWRHMRGEMLPDGGVIKGMEGSSPTDIWAVGYSASISELDPLVMHWDGVSWTQVPAAPTADGALLNDVHAISSTDAWAVGDDDIEGPLAHHWDGEAWTAVEQPDLAVNMYDIDGVSPDDIWATGATFAEHWDGSRWRRTPIPAEYAFLSGVDAVTANDIWAVGTAGAIAETLILHSDGC